MPRTGRAVFKKPSKVKWECCGFVQNRHMILAAALLAQAFLALPVDGITCDRAEGIAQHVHADLAVYDRGHRVPVPAGIGINSTAGCLYWLHTHTADGVIHIESPAPRVFTLGNFLDIWDRDFPWKHPAVSVDGKPWKGDLRSIPLLDHERIVIQNGPPFVTPPPVDWHGL